MIPDDEDDGRIGYRGTDYGTGWFVGIVVALALLAISYLVFSANANPPKPSLEAFQYTPGNLQFACEPGAGPVWYQLQQDLELMRQRQDEDTSVAITSNLK